MTNRQSYQSLTDTYKSGTQVANKLGLYGGFMQAGILGVACSWKHVVTGYYEIAFPALTLLSFYFLIKDFTTLLRIEKNLTNMVIDGVELEKKTPKLGRFLHDILKDFNLARTLIQRSFVNILALFGLSYLIYQFISDLTPNLEVHYVLLGSVSVFFSVLAAKLYYDVLKELSITKAHVFVG